MHNRSQQAQQKITKATKEQTKQSSLETSNIPIERLQFPWYCRAQPFTNCLDRGLKRPSTDRLYLFCFCYFVFYYVYYLCICEQAFGYIFRIFDFFFSINRIRFCLWNLRVLGSPRHFILNCVIEEKNTFTNVLIFIEDISLQ